MGICGNCIRAHGTDVGSTVLRWTSHRMPRGPIRGHHVTLWKATKSPRFLCQNLLVERASIRFKSLTSRPRNQRSTNRAMLCLVKWRANFLIYCHNNWRLALKHPTNMTLGYMAWPGTSATGGGGIKMNVLGCMWLHVTRAIKTSAKLWFSTSVDMCYVEGYMMATWLEVGSMVLIAYGQLPNMTSARTAQRL